MNGGRTVRPFPWQALERLSRDAARAGGRVRRAVAEGVDLSRVPSALSEVLGAETTAYLNGIRVGDAPRAAGSPLVCARSESADVWLYCDSELVTTAVGRLLQRPVSLSDAQPADPSVAGAFAAMAAEVVRRAHGQMPFHCTPATTPPPGPGAQLDFTLVVDGRAFKVDAWAVCSEQSLRLPGSERQLSDLGPLPITVPLVAALAQFGHDELSELGVGDAFMPGEGWWIDRQLGGVCALASGGRELGVEVELSPDGQIVVRGETRSLSLEESKVSQPDGPEDDALSAAALDAPLVVRVEFGSVTLSAREWAELGPGDVIETGRRLAEPVVLRVGGQEVARGELVDVEGELGVKIQSLSAGRE